jgi:hypothetical protein
VPKASTTAQDRNPARSVLGPHSDGELRTTAGRSGHQAFAETAGRLTYSVLTSEGGDKRRGVRVSPPGCREPSGRLPTRRWSPGRASPSGQVGAVAARRKHRRSCRPCHPRAISSGHQRCVADSYGHSAWTVDQYRPLLTWGGGAGRTCMACKGSSTPPCRPRIDQSLLMRLSGKVMERPAS